MLKIGHYWIFLRRFKKMVTQQKIYRIARQRFAENFDISIEILENNKNDNKPNNFA